MQSLNLINLGLSKIVNKALSFKTKKLCFVAVDASMNALNIIESTLAQFKESKEHIYVIKGWDLSLIDIFNKLNMSKKVILIIDDLTLNKDKNIFQLLEILLKGNKVAKKLAFLKITVIEENFPYDCLRAVNSVNEMFINQNCLIFNIKKIREKILLEHFSLICKIFTKKDIFNFNDESFDLEKILNLINYTTKNEAVIFIDKKTTNETIEIIYGVKKLCIYYESKENLTKLINFFSKPKQDNQIFLLINFLKVLIFIKFKKITRLI